MSFAEFYRDWKPRIDEVARELGLDVAGVWVEEIPLHLMREILAYGTLRRFSHPRFGGRYIEQGIGEFLGQSHIYEVVEFTQPPTARLLDSNALEEHILVYAHALGHAHLFRRGVLAREADPGVMDAIGVNAKRIARLEGKYGTERVHEVLHRGLTLMFHADWERLHRPTAPQDPAYPEQDLMWFLAHYRKDGVQDPLVRECLLILREEAFYFSAILRSKWMHEGFSCYVQERIIDALDLPGIMISRCREFHRSVVDLRGGKKLFSPYAFTYRLMTDVCDRYDGYRRRWQELERLYADGAMSRDVRWFRETLQCGGNVVTAPTGEVVASKRDGHGEIMAIVETVRTDEELFRQYLTQGFMDRHHIFSYRGGCKKHAPIPNDGCGRCQKNVVVSRNPLDLLARLLPLVHNGGVYEVYVRARRDDRLTLEHHWLPFFLGMELQSAWMEAALNDVSWLWGGPVGLHSKLPDGRLAVYKYVPGVGLVERGKEKKQPNPSSFPLPGI